MTPGSLETGLRELVAELVREEVDRVRAELTVEPAPPPADTMSADEAASYLKCSRSTLENKRSQGNGPPYERNGRRIIYRRSVLDQWMRDSRGRR